MSTISPESNAVVVSDLRPAAAYLLGGHSRMVKGWLDSCTHYRRDYFGLQPALIINLNEMDAAVQDLKDEFEAGVCHDLRAAIRAVKNCVLDDFDYQRGIQNWHVLCSETDGAFHRSHPFFCWYDLGRTVGQYRQSVIALGEGEPLPDFRVLRDRFRERLEEVGEEVPILQALVDHGETLATKPVYALHKVLKEKQFYALDEGNGMVAGMLLSKLHNLIHEQLSALTRIEECVNEKPIWDDKRAALFWRGKVIREYKRDPAENQVELIEAFHRANWPWWIPNPFNKTQSINPKKLSNTIYELNRTLLKGTIRFRGDGSGEGVCWAPVTKRQ